MAKSMISAQGLLLICSLLVFSSCQNEYEKRLTKKGNFWYVTYSDTEDGDYDDFQNIGYRFHRGGRYGYGYFSFEDKAPCSMDTGDLHLLYKWRVDMENQLLFIDDQAFEIKSFIEDTLIVYCNRSRRYEKYINWGEGYPPFYWKVMNEINAQGEEEI